MPYLLCHLDRRCRIDCARRPWPLIPFFHACAEWLSGPSSSPERRTSPAVPMQILHRFSPAVPSPREALENRPLAGAATWANWDLYALTDATEGFSRASLGVRRKTVPRGDISPSKV